MKKIIISILLILGLGASALAQSKIKVSGVVSDEQGQPMIGVGVVDKSNPRNGTITDENGKYNIQMARDGILEFSFISYKKTLEPVNGRSSINVQLEPDNQTLEATIVIGYGTSKKGDLTGSVAVVDMDEIQNVPSASVTTALQGRIAGAEISSQTGEPGESGTIQIRGSRSISAGNEPLIVVDGVPDAVSSLSDINPSDIVSISVLKDVSSTAIYGSRGANGVVLVTTNDSKKPEGKYTLDFKASAGVSAIAGTLDIMNAEEYATWRNMVAYNRVTDKASWVPVYTQKDLDYYAQNSTDWIKALSQVAVYQNYYLKLKGVLDGGKTYYGISFGFNNTPGVVRGALARKYTGNVFLHSQVLKKLSVDLSLAYFNRYVDKTNAAISGTNTSAAQFISPMLNTESTWNSFGTGESYGGMPYNNPYICSKEIINESFNQYFNISPSVRYDFVKHAWANVRFSYLGSRAESGYYSPSYLPVALANSQGGTARRGNWNQQKLLTEVTLHYKNTFKRKHSLEALLGYTLEHSKTDSQSYQGVGYTNDALSYKNMGGLLDPAAFTPSSEQILYNKHSIFARLNYSYDKRYYITGTVRADGASNFAPHRKWGVFPALALRWSIMNEKWFKRSYWLNDLSLRLSAGQSGNDAISSYLSMPALASSYGSWLFGGEKQMNYAPQRMANMDLTWETTTSYNAGIDFSAWKSRVNIELEGYISDTKDLLLPMRIAQTTGYTSYTTNLGAIRNMGVEFTLNTKNIAKKNFTWTTTFTISHNKQMVLDVGSENEVVPTYTNPRNNTQYMYGYKKGYPANALWGYQYEGIWHNEDEFNRNKYTHTYAAQSQGGSAAANLGRPKYADINHDGILDQNDIVYLGSADAVVYGGFQNTFTIMKSLTIGIYFAYSIGGNIYNLSELYSGVGCSSYNKYRYMLKAWTPADSNPLIPSNPDTDIPKAGYDETIASSRQVHDASYLRLKTVDISYNIPLSRKVKKVLKGLTVGVTGENLWLLKNYNGFDPDVNSSSSIYRLDNGSFPRPRTVVVNVNFKF